MLTTRPLALQRPLHFTCDGRLTSGTIQDPAVATTSETAQVGSNAVWERGGAGYLASAEIYFETTAADV